MNNSEYKICSRGIWDTTIPGIKFNEDGVSNYAIMFDKLCKAYPRGERGKIYWENIVDEIKERGKKKNYDCIIGVSGGTDSSYLLYIAKQNGLRPLAVNLENGWNTDISVKNIKKVTKALNIDLETYVIDYEEIKDLLRSYMRASLPWIDFPTDIAIKSVLYKIAIREGIKFILRGNDFRSEGTQPKEWSYSDGKQLIYVHNKFGTVKRKSFPNQTIFNIIYASYFRNVKHIYPYYFIDYEKRQTQEFLKKEFGWEYYGGHHHENSFTKFAISYWLPKKFGIDKRKITLSAQVLSGEITREYALEEIKKPHYDTEKMEMDKNFVLKKLDISQEEFSILLKKENKFFTDYPSNYQIMQRFIKIVNPFVVKIMKYKPMTLFQIEMRN